MADDHVKHVDILIVGGGLTGALLKIALAETGYQCLLLDTSPSPSCQDGLRYVSAANPVHPVTSDINEPRALALSFSSVQILASLNVWPLIEPYATPMHLIHVSEKGVFGATRLKSSNASPLGYVVEMQRLQENVNTLLVEGTASKSTENRLKRTKDSLENVRIIGFDRINKSLTYSHGGKITTVVATLIVGADGSDSRLRELSGLSAVTHHYEQYALVANVTLARSHQYHAYERFTWSGPLALLPMRDKTAALIWTIPASWVEKLRQLKTPVFLSEVQKTFGYRLGRFVDVGKRSFFPLKQVIMPTTSSFPCVFIGNAAQTIHPVAGQGFNLGLRDVATLAQCIIEQGLSAEMLANYQTMRAKDQRIVLRATHEVIQLFASRFPGMGAARQLGLVGLDMLPFLKTHLVQYASGLGAWAFGGVAPDLVCGINLPKSSTIKINPRV